MKRIILVLILLLVSGSVSATPLVDRTSDSLAITFYMLDSLGNPVDDATNDSVWISIISPYGAEVYSDSMLFTDGRITEIAWGNFGNNYVFSDLVSDIDGTSTTHGWYSFFLIAKDNSLSLTTPFRGTFQILSNNFNTSIDSTTGALSDGSIGDKVWTDGTFTIRAYIAELLDSLRSQDDWVGHQSTNDSTLARAIEILDSIYNLPTVAQMSRGVWDVPGADDTVYGAGTMGAEATQWDGAGSSGADTNDIKTMLANNMTSALGGLGWANMFGDSVWTYGTRSLTALGFTLQTTDFNGVTSFWNEGKTGYSLIQAFPANFADLLIATTTGYVTVGTNNDKTNYSISGTKTTLDALNDFDPTTDSTLLANRGEIAKQNADSTWTRSSRTLSSLGFVLDSLGFDESYWHKIANRSDSGNVGSTSITASDIAMIADTLFNRLVSDTVPGTYLSTLLSLSASGGSGGATANEIMDSLFNRLVSDTTTGTFLSELYRSLINVRDSIFVYDTRFDSLLNAIADANKPNFMATTTGLLSTSDISTIASQSADSVLEDSSAYQGSASGLTAEEIASTVNDTLTAQHPGNWAATGSSGNGAYTYTVTLVDTGATVDSVLPFTLIFVNNVDQDMTPYQVETDNNGEAVFNLNAGTWVKFTTEPGYAPTLDTFTVSATGADSLFVYRDAGTMTTVAFQIDKPNSYPYASAKISIDLVSVNDSSLLWVNDTVLAAASYQDLEVTTSDYGLASINLHANSSISNDSTYYKVLIRDNRSRRIIDQFKFNVPVSDTTVWIQYLTRW